tara:strand:+ start:262 stop:951 length:690 start_codon:yes stop_codon:yes gene_type:complete
MKWLLESIQYFLFGNLLEAMHKINYKYNQSSFRMKKLGDIYDSVIVKNKDLESQMAQMQKQLKSFHTILEQQAALLASYNEKFNSLACIQTNMTTIFKEIDTVRDFAGNCHTELIKNLKHFQQGALEIKRLIEIDDNVIKFKNNNGNIIGQIDENSFSKGAWTFKFTDTALEIINQSTNIIQVSSNNPILQLHYNNISTSGVSKQHTANFSIDPNEDNPLNIHCDTVNI